MIEKSYNKNLHDMHFFFKFQENVLIMNHEMDGLWCMHAGEKKYIRSFVWENVKEIEGLDTLVQNGRCYE